MPCRPQVREFEIIRNGDHACDLRIDFGENGTEHQALSWSGGGLSHGVSIDRLAAALDHDLVKILGAAGLQGR